MPRTPGAAEHEASPRPSSPPIPAAAAILLPEMSRSPKDLIGDLVCCAVERRLDAATNAKTHAGSERSSCDAFGRNASKTACDILLCDVPRCTDRPRGWGEHGLAEARFRAPLTTLARKPAA